MNFTQHTKVNFEAITTGWKGGDPIPLLMIWGVQVDISSLTISRFLYGPEYQASINTGEMDYRME